MAGCHANLRRILTPGHAGPAAGSLRNGICLCMAVLLRQMRRCGHGCCQRKAAGSTISGAAQYLVATNGASAGCHAHGAGVPRWHKAVPTVLAATRCRVSVLAKLRAEEYINKMNMRGGAGGSDYGDHRALG